MIKNFYPFYCCTLRNLSSVSLPKRLVILLYPILYYTNGNNLKSFKICCLFSGGIIISCGCSCGFSSLTFNEVILFAVSDPATSTAAEIILSDNYLVASFLIFYHTYFD